MLPIKIYSPFPLSKPNEIVLRNSSFFEFIENPDTTFYFTLVRLKHDQITEDIINELKNKKTILIVTDDWEAHTFFPVNDCMFEVHKWENINPITFIKEIAEKNNLNLNQFVYIDANIKMPAAFKRKNINGIFFSMSESYLETINIDEVTNDILNKRIREKKFLFLGGRSRSFRIKFLQKTNKILNFENDSFISLQYGDYFNVETKKFESFLGKTLDLKLGEDTRMAEDQIKVPLKKDFHLNSYINIASLTYHTYANNHFQINEKMFKAIITMQPFLILGQPQALQVLKQLGYKTFDNWINESYDNILNNEDRMNALVDEIDRLNKLRYDELADMMVDMLPILKYNAQLFQTRKYSDYVCKNLADELREFIPC